jgi:glycosyltransferase involved in cell wall biosynthesis
MVTTDSHAPYIQEAIASVQAQTLTDWELVIQDDGPRWLAGKAIAKYIKDDARISYERQDNAGIWKLACTYNRALDRTTAPYVAILESDDFWPADKLKTQISALEQSDAVLSYGVVQHVESDGKTLLEQGPDEALRQDHGALHNSPAGRTAIVMGYRWQFLSPPTIVIRRSDLDAIGGFQYRDYYPSTDFPTVMELSARGSFDFQPRIMGYSRRHGNSATARGLPFSVFATGHWRCWREVLEKHQFPVSSPDVQHIHSTWNERLADYRWLRGRKSACAGQRLEARRHFRLARPYLPPSTRLMSGVANTLSGFSGGEKMIEPLYRALGKIQIHDETLQEELQESHTLITAYDSWTGWLKDYAKTHPASVGGDAND